MIYHKIHICNLYIHHEQDADVSQKIGIWFQKARKDLINTIREGHKDYKCESCGKSFSEAGNLRKHILKVHEGNIENK